VASMAEKKVKGRKRHIAVDSQGHLLDVLVTRANRHDTNVGLYVMDGVKNKYPAVQAFSAEAAYRGNSSWYAEILLENAGSYLAENPRGIGSDSPTMDWGAYVWMDRS